MLKYIIGRLKKHHIKNLVVKDERILAFQNLDAVKECTLFWIAEDVSWTEIERIQKLLAKHMNVHLLSFIRQSKSEFERVEKVLYADEASIFYGGKFRDMELKELLERKDGLFIDLSLTPDALGDYIVRYAKSACKVGMPREGIEHDIVFANVQRANIFIDRLFKLFTKINTY